MSDPEIKDTYYAALQHGHVEPKEDDLLLGVVRKPMYGIKDYLDKNVTDLAPPFPLLGELKELSKDIDHNDACEELDFLERYREFLQNDRQQELMEWVINQSESKTVWLVCYENTDDKICHRTVLKEELYRLSQ